MGQVGGRRLSCRGGDISSETHCQRFSFEWFYGKKDITYIGRARGDSGCVCQWTGMDRFPLGKTADNNQEIQANEERTWRPIVRLSIFEVITRYSVRFNFVNSGTFCKIRKLHYDRQSLADAPTKRAPLEMTGLTKFAYERNPAMIALLVCFWWKFASDLFGLKVTC